MLLHKNLIKRSSGTLLSYDDASYWRKRFFEMEKRCFEMEKQCTEMKKASKLMLLCKDPYEKEIHQ